MPGSDPQPADGIEMETLHEREQQPNTNGIRSKHKDYFVGIGILFAVVLLWTISNFVTQASYVHFHCKLRFMSTVHVGPVRGWIR